MSSAINYSLPTGYLPAIALEFKEPGGSDYSGLLLGIATRIDIKGHGTHGVFPYASTSNTTFSTYSVLHSTPGTLTFGGVLVSDETVVSGLLAMVGSQNINNTAYLKIVSVATAATLVSWGFDDFRIGGASLDMHTMQSYTMVRGTFQCTFRRMFTPSP